jgi:cation/acetate symporter
MNDVSWIGLAFVIAMTGATIGLGLYATKKARTASDFFVAGRSVSVFWNASAISGEYLSAASFMGIAGLLMKFGYDALWYPVCYATGYLFLLLFIAGPLRRFGAYTIPDFAEGRFDSPMFRRIAVTFVLFIGFFYTMPQMKGAGVTLGAIMNWPYWAGIVVVGAVITFNVAFGGMKGITFVQAFQYWAKVFAISVPIFVLMTVYGGYGKNLGANAGHKEGTAREGEAAYLPHEDKHDYGEPEERHVERAAVGHTPVVPRDIPLKFKGREGYPANAIAFSPMGVTRLEFPDGATFDKVTPAPFASNGSGRLPFRDLFAPGLKGNEAGDGMSIPPGGVLEVYPYQRTDPNIYEHYGSLAAKVELKTKTTAVLKAGSPAPNAPADRTWLRPFGPFTSKYGYPLLYTYSLIIALICGTAGLPHILVRFYTNPDGRAAKRTTLWVMVMLGSFYVFPPIWGVLGRNAMPWLYANDSTDSVVIRLPTILSNKLLGEILSGITAAGAFAAFMSTFSGLLVSMSGALAHDIYGKILRPKASPESRMTAFKVSAVAIGLASVGLGLLVESFDIAKMVGWAFAIAAASYFPLLLLGSWWKGLTKFGAASGMLIGGLASLAAIVTSMLLEKKLVTFTVHPLVRSLMEQPAIWGVPLSIAIMFGVSKLTHRSVPDDIHMKMLRLHAPEEMGLSKNYIEH